jgi:hypothetical protein
LEDYVLTLKSLLSVSYKKEIEPLLGAEVFWLGTNEEVAQKRKLDCDSF